MTDFFAQNPLYVVMVVVLVVWAGILTYLFRIDRRLKKIEQESKKS